MFTIRAARDTLADLPGIETARLSIAALRPEDASALRRLTDDPAITAAVDFLPTPFTLQDAEDLIRGGARGQDRFLGAWTRGADAGASGGSARALPVELVGVVGTHLRGAGTIEIGYWIGGAARGRGFAHEAVSAIIALLGQRFPARTIVAECRPANVASWGLLQKLGFRDTGEEGHRPGRRLLQREGN
ncbi:GNAT family N-acetyltransferase [Methylobacterium sp. P31]